HFYRCGMELLVRVQMRTLPARDTATTSRAAIASPRWSFTRSAKAGPPKLFDCAPQIKGRRLTVGLAEWERPGMRSDLWQYAKLPHDYVTLRGLTMFTSGHLGRP